jgi:hydrophobe/amphiphile efflux-3 (HAE3) family protein
MTKKSNLVNKAITKMSKSVTKHPAKISAFFIIITLLMLIPISQIESQSNMSDFIPDNEFVEAREIMVDEFNVTHGIISVVKAESGNILDRDGLVNLIILEKEVMENDIIKPYLITHKDPVVSIADVVDGILLASSNGTMNILNAPEEQLDATIAYVLSQKEFVTLVSKGDGNERQYAMLMVIVDYKMYADEMYKGDETLEIEIEDTIKNAESDGYKIYSLAAMNREIQKNTEQELSLLLPICIIIMIVILFVALRSIGDLAISLTGLLVTLIISFGLFSILGLPFNQLTFFAPIFILVLSVGFAIHILMRYKEEKENYKVPEKSMVGALKFVGISITLSAFTTIAAFASNGFSDIPAIASFGIFIALGIAVAYIVMMTFVPALKLVSERLKLRFRNRRVKTKSENLIRKKPKRSNPLSRRALVSAGRLSYNHPIIVLIIILGITIGGFYLASFIERDISPEEIYSTDSEKLYTYRLMSDEFPHASPYWISILISGDLTDPFVLTAMDKTISNMDDDSHVVKNGDSPNAVSILNYVKGFMSSGVQIPGVQDFNNDDIPDTKSGVTIVLEYLYMNGIPNMVQPEDIQSVLSRGNELNTFDMALITIEVRDVDGMRAGLLLEELDEDIEPLEEINGVEVKYMGQVFEGYVALESMTEGMILSTGLSIMLCSVMVIVLFWSFRYGIITALPVILVTGWILGSILLLGFSLNPVTATTTAMTVGIGIDYSIHLMERYRQERRKGRSIKSALDTSIGYTGMALLSAGLTTALGFGVISFSNIGMFYQFGVLAFLIIVYVVIAAILVLPAFIMLSEKLKAWFSVHFPSSIIADNKKKSLTMESEIKL